MSNNTAQTAVAMPRLIRRKEVLARVGLSQTSMYEQIADGQFPKPIPIGPKSVAWLSTEIEAWINHRTALRASGRKPAPGDLRI